MIFDSLLLQDLLVRYKHTRISSAPGIIQLARLPECQAERDQLEKVISTAPPEKQRDWLGRLLDPSWGQYKGAWFEMMLYHWLEGVGKLTVEPEIENVRPDFLVECDGEKILLDAVVRCIPQEERTQDQVLGEVFEILQDVEIPYIIHVDKISYTSRPDLRLLKSQVTAWLSQDADTPFTFSDRNGSQIFLRTEGKFSGKRAVCTSMGEGYWLNPDVLKPSLKAKASKYNELLSLGYKFVIALFIESHQFTAEEVADAWFGNLSVVIDIDRGKILREEYDRSGLHFWNNDVRYKSFSGTLVFKNRNYEDNQDSWLNGIYIQNPFCSQPITPWLFPVNRAYLVVERSSTGYQMNWQSNPRIVT